MRLPFRDALVPAASIVVAGASAHGGQESSGSALVGAWAVEASTDAGGESRGDPTQRGLYIFTAGGHYSAVFSTAPRPRAATHFSATDEEKVGQYDTIIVNTGTYEVSGSTVTMRPMIAKSAEYVGGNSVSKFTVDGDTLTLEGQGTTSGGGTKLPGGGTLSLWRIE